VPVWAAAPTAMSEVATEPSRMFKALPMPLERLGQKEGAGGDPALFAGYLGKLIVVTAATVATVVASAVVLA